MVMRKIKAGPRTVHHGYTGYVPIMRNKASKH